MNGQFQGGVQESSFSTSFPMWLGPKCWAGCVWRKNVVDHVNLKPLYLSYHKTWVLLKVTKSPFPGVDPSFHPSPSPWAFSLVDMIGTYKVTEFSVFICSGPLNFSPETWQWEVNNCWVVSWTEGLLIDTGLSVVKLISLLLSCCMVQSCYLYRISQEKMEISGYRCTTPWNHQSKITFLFDSRRGQSYHSFLRTENGDSGEWLI